LDQKRSSVDLIINALAELEKDLDNLTFKVEEMKKRIIIYSNEEIEKLKQQIIAIANEEATKIIDIAKAEAEGESATIVKEADTSLSGIKKNIDSSYDRAVDSIVKMVLGETTSNLQKITNNTDVNAKPVRYTSEGKPVIR
jgi:vacuolar-type H+-ATPase subunit H